MKLAPLLRLLALLAFSSNSFGADARPDAFRIGVTPSTTTPAVNADINYTITVANQTGLPLTDTHVISFFPEGFTIQSATDNVPNSNPLNPLSNEIAVDRGHVDYAIDVFPNGQTYTFLLSLKMNQATAFTNSIVVTNASRIIGNTTNVVTGAASTSTNTTQTSDLQVALSGVPSAIIAHDAFSYTITVNNLGPNSASGVIVQNTIPSGSIVAAVSSPTAVTRTGDTVTWQVGSLAKGASQTLEVTLQPTNVVNATITASVQAPNNADANSANDSATNAISVQPIVTTSIFLTRGTQTFNRQNGLFEETVNVLNVGDVTLPTVRVVVQNLVSPDLLYNMSGTNGVYPYVASTVPLPPGISTNLLLQFFSHDRTFKTNLTLVGLQGPGPITGSSTNETGTNGFKLTALRSSGLNFLSFPATIGSNYSVLASRDVSFTNSIPISVNSSNRSTSLVAVATRIVLTNASPFTNGNVFFRAVQNP
jgi:uncharacterized repeat protein (TIGR01451 family)